MRSSEKFEFTDPRDCNSETNLANMSSGGKKNGGCYVSGAMGVALTLLAVLIAVGVGLIVYFATGDRDIVCQWGDGSSSPVASAIKECAELARNGNQDVCGVCPAATTNVPGSGCEATTTTQTPAPTETPKVTDVRLPTSLYPEHYDVVLQPYMYSGDPKDFTFKGFVRIYLECKEATNNVTVHVNVLTIDESSVSFRGEAPRSNDPRILNMTKDEDRQFFIVHLDKNMVQGSKYILAMNFTSPLKDDLAGLYLSQYTRGNETVYLATTQMQPTDARKTFPCFDEPAIKSTFNITLVRKQDLVAVSNMPHLYSSTPWDEGGITYVADTFEITPKMPTYLLAFVISDFKAKYNTTKYNVTYGAWSIPESLDEVDYSLWVGTEVLTYFEDYFEIKFPLPKQDMMAVPDFAAGAMENWGLILYRETAMLYKPGVSTEANRERVAVVVSHELAHQWFGDLVTPSWWDDLWLNEGFASFVEYMGVDKIHPEWKMFDVFAISSIQSALSFDGLISSHPIYVPVAHPDEINEIFDLISYEKGASIIRMMRFFLGEETFRKGLVLYLNENAYDAAFHDELWSALTRQSMNDSRPIDVKDIMDTWTLQMNYPVVTVTRDFNKLGTLHVTQHRYLVDPEAEDPGKYDSPFGYKWNIPLTFTSSENPMFEQNYTHVHWMYKNETKKTIDIGANQLPASTNQDGWILANVMQYGYYRVNYNDGNWERLAKALKTNHNVFSVINRAQMIDDSFNLAKSGDLGMRVPLAIIDYLDKEFEGVPWSAASGELNYVSLMLSLTPMKGAFNDYMLTKLEPPYTHYGLDTTNATHVETAARLHISYYACSYGLDSCLNDSKNMYANWMKDPENNGVDPNIKRIVYAYGVATGGWDEWNFALQRYKQEQVASEKALLLSALSYSREPWILNYYLYLLLEDNSPIRSQDSLSVISYVSDKVIGRPLAWDFFRANYDAIRDKFGVSLFSWTRTIGRVTQGFNTEFELQQILDFVQSKAGQLGSGERAFQQAIEKTRSNIKWMEKNGPILREWLREKNVLEL